MKKKTPLGDPMEQAREGKQKNTGVWLRLEHYQETLVQGYRNYVSQGSHEHTNKECLKDF